MSSFELIQILCKGVINTEQCGTFSIKSNDLHVLTEQFGYGIAWEGQFVISNYFYYWQPIEEDPEIEEYNMKGVYEDPDKGVWYLYRLS